MMRRVRSMLGDGGSAIFRVLICVPINFPAPFFSKKSSWFSQIISMQSPFPVISRIAFIAAYECW